MNLPPPDILIAYAIVIFFAIGLHEYAHCKVADLSGDPTPRYHGRVTLNLTKHFELMGTIMMILTALSGVGLGWGKAAPIDPRKMRNPRWDLFATVAAGPVSNLLQAAVYALVIRFMLMSGAGLAIDSFAFTFLYLGVTVNLGLCFFNLIPFGPLDGHWLVGQLLPEKQAFYWYRFNRTVGIFGLFGVIILFDLIANNGGPDIMGLIMRQPIEAMFRFLTGIGRG